MSFEISTSIVFGARINPDCDTIKEKYLAMDWDAWRHSNKPYVIQQVGVLNGEPISFILHHRDAYHSFSDRWTVENNEWVVDVDSLGYPGSVDELYDVAHELNVELIEEPKWLLCAIGG